MAQGIQEDVKRFVDIISGKSHEELQKYIKQGGMFRLRGKDGKIHIPIPRIEMPYFSFGKAKEGIGRGKGKPGDILERGKNGKGQPGKDPGEGMIVSIDMEDVMKMLKEELELPDMKPKPNQTYEDVKTVYNGISKTGPNSLLHKRRTMLACMKRMASMGLLNNKVLLPHLNTPVSILAPINEDKKFRQYNEIKIPSSNACIFFMRDGSGSMDKVKCDIVSDIAWWIEAYIRRFYDKTETIHIWHDTEAKEVSSKQFYELRYGGGTYCTSALKLMEKIISTRFNPLKWNIYGLYFGDGEAFGDDNKQFAKMLQGPIGPNVVNMFGQVEILHYDGFGDSLKRYLDSVGSKKIPHLRNVSIDRNDNAPWDIGFASEDERNEQVKKVIKAILGKGKNVHGN